MYFFMTIYINFLKVVFLNVIGFLYYWGKEVIFMAAIFQSTGKNVISSKFGGSFSSTTRK